MESARSVPSARSVQPADSWARTSGLWKDRTVTDSPPVWAGVVELTASIGFSGVVRLDRPGAEVLELAMGLADQRHGIPIEIATRFGVASATKTLTALTIVSLVESGELTLDTTLRSVTADILPLVDPSVTIEHLLGHTSGVGDYLDEVSIGDIDEYLLGVSPHMLVQPTDYVVLMEALPQVFRPGERFAYNNGGYVMLSMVIELITGSFHAAVGERVLEPAGMTDAGFFRSDDLPSKTAMGYLEDGRTNVLHLPVIGSGDGGIYLTLDDVTAFWTALFRGDIVSAGHVAEMTSVHRSVDDDHAYGLGFWLSPDGRIVSLEGMDAGVSFRSAVDRRSGSRYTVMSNTSTGIWPLARVLEPLISSA